MNLNNNQITVGQLLENPQARAVLDREFPGLSKNPLVQRARGLTLAQVLQLLAGQVSPSQVQRILTALQEI